MQRNIINIQQNNYFKGKQTCQLQNVRIKFHDNKLMN